MLQGPTTRKRRNGSCSGPNGSATTMDNESVIGDECHIVFGQKQGFQGNGIEAQKQAVARYLASMDCELVGTFEEVESGANNKRPQLAAAIQTAKSKKAVLVIAKLDRLSRNAAFLLQLQDSGVD